ncbi:hypothetical protein N9026_00215 [bacterium]|nr:hypothetical protein [bacterium]
MSERPGFTVSPAMYEDQFGNTHVSFDNAIVVDHGRRQQIQAEALDDQTSFITQDSEGNLEHQWDFEGTEEVVNYIHSDEDDAETYDADEGEFDLAEYIFDEILPESDYDQIIAWAGENCSEEYIDWFDATIDAGDVSDIEEAINALIDAFNDDIDFQ